MQQLNSIVAVSIRISFIIAFLSGCCYDLSPTSLSEKRGEVEISGRIARSLVVIQ